MKGCKACCCMMIVFPFCFAYYYSVMDQKMWPAWVPMDPGTIFGHILGGQTYKGLDNVETEMKVGMFGLPGAFWFLYYALIVIIVVQCQALLTASVIAREEDALILKFPLHEKRINLVDIKELVVLKINCANIKQLTCRYKAPKLFWGLPSLKMQGIGIVSKGCLWNFVVQPQNTDEFVADNFCR